jgi:multiple sugar transport system permease protein
MRSESGRARTRLLKTLALVLGLAFMLVFTLTPIVWMFLTSLKTGADAFAMPPKFFFEPTLDHYRRILALGGERSIFQAFRNSLHVTIVTTAISIVVATLAGYSLARLRPRGAGILTVFIIGVRMLPPIVLVVPLFQLVFRLGLQDTPTALIIPYTALTIPLATFMMYGFFLDLPRELEEAAMIDGASRIAAFWRVILPLATPGLAATAIFTALLPWNDLVFALPMTTIEATTLPVVAARTRVEEGILWGQLGAIATIMTIPVILFTFFVQRYIVRGLTGGAVKG